MTTLTEITLKNGIPTFNDKEVILNTLQQIILAGKGEGGSVLMRTKNIVYKEDYDRKNNKQNPTCSLHS